MDNQINTASKSSKSSYKFSYLFNVLEGSANFREILDILNRFECNRKFQKERRQTLNPITKNL